MFGQVNISDVDRYYPSPWHIERSGAHGDNWEVWDSRGHIIAASHDYEPEDKAAMAIMARAMDMYGLLCTLDHNGVLPEKTAMGFHARYHFDKIRADLEKDIHGKK